MPRPCNVYGCRGNYRGEPYSRVIQCPNNSEIRRTWINAMPNERESLEKLKQIWICRRHFDCPFTTVQGGSKPTGPPTKIVPKTSKK